MHKKTLLVVTTVGDSLSSNYALRKLGAAVDKGANELSAQRDDLLPWFSLADEIRRPPAETELRDYIGRYTACSGVREVPCAEIQSLLLLCEWLGKNGYDSSEVRVLLIPTKETKPTADIICSWITSQAQSIKTYYVCTCVCAEVQGGGVEMDVNTGADFRAGLAEYVKTVIAALNDKPAGNGDYVARFLNVTGGYKGLIPVLSLLGFTESVNVCYCHEKSGEIILMPELPVAWDRRRLDEVRGYVLRGQVQKEEYEKLPDDFRFLFNVPDGADHCQLSALGELVAKAPGRDLQTRFGYGRYLMRMLEPADAELLRRKLPEWEHLWLGDQIPETVEHSRLHTLRLLGFAYQLFSAYPELLKNVGGSHGLYLLICALWLHDIGHSALEYQVDKKHLPLALMPSLVREWHHYTSAWMIRNSSYLDDTKDKEAVALITEYHRGEMVLNTGDDFDDPYGYGIFMRKCPTLAKRLDKMVHNGGLPNGINPAHVLAIAAILRFLDGCDVQADRVGDEKYRDARELRTKREVEFLEARLAKIELSGAPRDSYKEDKTKRYKAFGNLHEKTEAEDLAKLQVVSLCDQIVFKNKQYEHFKEHQSIELAFLYVNKDRKLRVGLVPARTDCEAVKLLKKRADGIANEYCLVKRILQPVEIDFDGTWVVHKNKEVRAKEWNPSKEEGDSI